VRQRSVHVKERIQTDGQAGETEAGAGAVRCVDGEEGRCGAWMVKNDLWVGRREGRQIGRI
jgi:hypothetical protein